MSEHDDEDLVRSILNELKASSRVEHWRDQTATEAKSPRRLAAVWSGGLVAAMTAAIVLVAFAVHRGTPSAPSGPAGSPSIPIASVSPTPPGLRIDGTSVTKDSVYAATIRSNNITTHFPNELVLALVATKGPANMSQSITGVSSNGQNWHLAQRSNTARGTSEIWYAVVSQPTTLHAVALRQNNAQGLLMLVAVSGADPLHPIGTVGAAGSATGLPSVTIAPQTNNGLVFGVGNDSTKDMSISPRPNQTVLDQYLETVSHDTYWVQRIDATTTAGQPVVVGDVSPSTDEWNLAVVEIRPAS